MKRILSMVLCFVVMLSVLPMVGEPMEAKAWGDDRKEYGDLYYTVVGGKVTITDAKEGITKAVIPSKIAGLPVTTIGTGAFYYCDRLKSVVIPDSVKIIGVINERPEFYTGAFYECTALTTVTLGKNVKTIGDYTFSGCSAIKTVNTLKSLKAKKTYYLRVRTLKKVNGKTYYSAWSKTYKKKTK